MSGKSGSSHSYPVGHSVCTPRRLPRELTQSPLLTPHAVKEFFPAELQDTLEGEDGHAARGAVGKAVRKKLILSRPEVAGMSEEERRRILKEKLDHAEEEEEGAVEGEEEEAEEEDYNYEEDEDEMGGDYDAEQYFDGGDLAEDEDVEGGGEDYS